VAGIGNLVMAGMGKSLAQDLDHPPRRPAGAPAADEKGWRADTGDHLQIILGRKHETPLGGDLGGRADSIVADRIGHLLPGIRPHPVGDESLGSRRILSFANQRQVALGEGPDLAPAIRLVRPPQQMKGDRLNQSETGNLLREAANGVECDRAAVGMPDQMHWPADDIEQGLDNPKLGVRQQRRVARPGGAAPIAQQVGSQGAIAPAEMFHGR
jgi:hypothetical protein